MHRSFAAPILITHDRWRTCVRSPTIKSIDIGLMWFLCLDCDTGGSWEIVKPWWATVITRARPKISSFRGCNCDHMANAQNGQSNENIDILNTFVIRNYNPNVFWHLQLSLHDFNLSVVSTELSKLVSILRPGIIVESLCRLELRPESLREYYCFNSKISVWNISKGYNHVTVSNSILYNILNDLGKLTWL